MKLINDWIDFICIVSLDFLIIAQGVWILPQLPEKTHFLFSFAILASASYFTKKAIEFLTPKIFKDKKTLKKKGKNK